MNCDGCLSDFHATCGILQEKISGGLDAIKGKVFEWVTDKYAGIND